MVTARHDLLIDTTRLVGRAALLGDLGFVARVWNDERVAPTVGGARTEQQLRRRLAEWARHWNDHGFGITIFRDRGTGDRIGWGGLQHSTIGIGECLTVGYVIAPDLWGRGYATEIAVASVDHAVRVLGAAELYASVAATNAASRRVLEKAGMSLHRAIDHGGDVEIIYAITHRSN